MRFFFKFYKKLEKLLKKFRDIFRCRLGKGEAADLEPMKVELEEGAKPIRAKVRNYSPGQRKVLKIFS